MKRKAISLKDKYEIIKKIESGTPKTQIATEFGIPRTSVQSIAKNQKEIKEKFENGHNSKAKRQKTVGCAQLEKPLQCSDNNDDISSLDYLSKLENDLTDKSLSRKKQSLLTDFLIPH